jgi:UDP-N-acetylmuramoylalanine--D-glutamate ligase
MVDLAAAAVAALEMGAGLEAVASVVTGFAPGPHRRTVVGEWDGVAWVDDSKATNPHAALAATAAYPSVILIAGGRNKGLNLAPLVAAGTVKHVVALGEARHDLVAASSDPGRVTEVGSLDEAVAVAGSVAQPGDTVLLAPGCASFDMFSSYGERGDAFAEAARRHNRRAGRP